MTMLKTETAGERTLVGKPTNHCSACVGARWAYQSFRGAAWTRPSSVSPARCCSHPWRSVNRKSCTGHEDSGCILEGGGGWWSEDIVPQQTIWVGRRSIDSWILFLGRRDPFVVLWESPTQRRTAGFCDRPRPIGSSSAPSLAWVPLGREKK